MATGDQTDIQARLRQLIPFGWFPAGAEPIVDGLLLGLGNALAFIYSTLAYLRLQTRIKTATDGFLDLIAGDFFGTSLPRLAGQSDDSYRARILASLLRERGTRKAVILVLQQLTGRTPIIFEPQRPADTGAYGAPNCGYGRAGGYGSRLMPYQALIIAYRPLGTGIPNVAGYGISTGAYRTPSQSEYASLSMINQTVTDSDIYAAVNSVRPIVSTLWTRISN